MAARASTPRARPEDVDDICRGLPETTFGTSWGDVPTWLVPTGDKGRGFVLYRKPHKSAVDPATGEEYDDLLVIRTANPDDKLALVEGSGPFFTIDHFNGFNAVLVQLSRLGRAVARGADRGDHGRVARSGAEEAGPRVPRMTPAGAGKGPRRASVDAARLAAYDVLVAVRQDDAYANLVLPQLLRERRIEGRDAAFTTELVGGTLRGLGTYDAVIDHLAGRRPDPPVRDALRLGAHQLLAMRVPDHAAVTSTVELVRTRVGHKPAGFTNAVLRRITKHDLDAWMDLLEAPTSVRFSHPQWIVDELAGALDRPDELEALLAADNARPRVTLVARPGLVDGRGARVRVHRTRGEHALAARGRPRVGGPRSDSGSPRRTSGRAGRRVTAGRACARPGLCRRLGRALAGPVRRSRREGGTARRAGHRARRAVAGQRAATAPREARRRCPASDHRRRRRGRRHPAAVGRQHLRPGAGRCALHRSRRPAPPSGEPLAAYPRRPPRPGAAPACFAAQRDRLSPARRGGPLRHVLARRRRDRRRGRVGPGRPIRHPARGHPRAGAGGAPMRSRLTCGAPYSCGRTATAPTRCSWPCSGG